MERLVVALGGNAITRAGEKGTWEEALTNMSAVASPIAELVARGTEVVLTHGNGPQVGSLLIQQEAAKSQVAELPMSAVGAMTQGWIGLLIAQALTRALVRRGTGRVVLPLITRVLVSGKDPSFRHPTKPVGPYYSENEARLLKKQKGWVLGNDPKRGGWRRLVPSPLPLEILEGPAMRRLLDDGLGKWALLVASGGGGIPVVRRGEGHFEGVDAVIDKDRTAALLGKVVGADTLAIVTDVPKVYTGFGTPKERALDHVGISEMSRYVKAGEFAAGSMGPKVEAALSFVKTGGKRAVITDAHTLRKALSSQAGTVIEP